MPHSLYHQAVPKGLVENLQYRKRIRRWAAESCENQHDLWIASARDILFWINTFVWTYNPRLEWKGGKWLPFITYPFQDEAILALVDCIGKRDMGVDKSRDQGASWIMIVVFDWFFNFHDDYSFMLVSRKEDLVDKTGDPDALFWKVDGIHDRLPLWMRPAPRHKGGGQNLQFVHPITRSTITGSSTTGDVARGGRRTAIGLDEFGSFSVSDSYEVLAATQNVTNCRIYNSTPKGITGAFYDVMHNLNIRKLHFDWFNHPIQRQGLYTTENKRLKIIDQQFWRAATVRLIQFLAPEIECKGPQDALARDLYPFILDGKVRAPYYDNECERTPVKSLIAQELDRDYLGAAGQFYEPADIVRLKTAPWMIPPFTRGEVDFDETICEFSSFIENDRGSWSLWVNLDHRQRPPQDTRYVMGVDVSAGSGASDSVISVFQRKNGEQVAEFRNNSWRPERLASLAHAVGWWFSFQPQERPAEPAVAIWEHVGVGADFGNRLWELGYRAVHFYETTTTIAKKKTKKIGWYGNEDTKRNLYTEFGRAAGAGECQLRSSETIAEMAEFVWTPGGGVAHAKALAASDGSDTKKNHGDGVSAGALAWREIRSTKAAKPVRRKRALPDSCPARRRKRKEDEELRKRTEFAVKW